MKQADSRIGQGKYEGWTNHATWNVNLWINNDYASYKAKIWLCLTVGASGLNAENVERFCRDILAGNEDFSPGDWDSVNWAEIAKEWADEAKEQA